MRIRAIPMLFIFGALSAAPYVTQNMRLLKDLARQGNVEAQYLLGLEYQDGIEVKPNPAEGEKWLLEAAQSGHAEAQFALGEFYSGKGNDPAHLSLAVKWYQAAAASGHAEAISRLGPLLSKGGRRGPAQLASTADQPQARAAAAALPADPSAEKGGPAQAPVAFESAEETVRWSLILSGLRGPDAWVVRGYMLENGIAMEREVRAAVTHYRAAAESGHSLGCYHLGLAYALGKGVPRDPVEACVWLRLAKAGGIGAAAEPLARWESELSLEQRTEVIRRARAQLALGPATRAEDGTGR